MPDSRIKNLAQQIRDGLLERNVTPTRLRVLAACTDAGLSSDEAQDVADMIDLQTAGEVQ
jgi:hypothetical protein